MKAHINGITVEGTPQEIMEYQRMQGEKAHTKPAHPYFDQQKHWLDYQEAQKKQQWVDCGSAEVPEYLKYPFIISMNL